jgi:DNA integrity scanning protein DisA with diadenylate cyclase activity
MFSIFYVYAILGMAIWSGEVTFNNEEIRGNDSTPDNWALNNFNDTANSFLVLFELIVVNNWMITAQMFVDISNTRWVLAYFVSFYIIAVLVGMNIVVCFAIDMYASIRRLDNEQTDHEEKLFSLAQEVKAKKKTADGNVGTHVTIITEENEEMTVEEREDLEDRIGNMLYEDEDFSVKKKQKKQVNEQGVNAS